MPEKIAKWNQTYEMIETSCKTTHHCVPCTYPNCQRNMKLRKTAIRSFGKG